MEKTQSSQWVLNEVLFVMVLDPQLAMTMKVVSKHLKGRWLGG